MIRIRGRKLLPFLHNILHAETDADGTVHLHRFTEEQIQIYQQETACASVDYAMRARASANVVLDLITDSQIIGLSFLLQEATRADFAAFDLYVDGVLWDHRRMDGFNYDLLCFDLPAGEHRVTVFFPWSAVTDVRELILSDGASHYPVERPLRILSFGDSITQGYMCQYPSLSYIGCITRAFNAELVNQGVGGYWFDERILDEALKQYAPDLITVAYGTNDYSWKKTLADFSAGASAFLDRLHSLFPQVPIQAIMPIFRCDTRFRDRRRTYDHSPEEAWEALRGICGKYENITVLEDTFYPRTEDFFVEDMVHPNNLGGMIYGQAVVEKIKAMGFNTIQNLPCHCTVEREGGYENNTDRNGL